MTHGVQYLAMIKYKQQILQLLQKMSFFDKTNVVIIDAFKYVFLSQMSTDNTQKHYTTSHSLSGCLQIQLNKLPADFQETF